MSLLLEALKKAERAKEDAERRARQNNEAPEAAAAEPDADATVAHPGRHVTTKNELPDISAPLEILSEDIRPGTQAKPAAATLALEEEPAASAPESKAPPRREAARAAETPAGSASDRAAAQKVFEAKFKEPNPRLPFYIMMGVLGAFAIGTVIYFWIQLRPAPSLVNANPARPTDEKPVDVAAVKPAAGAPGSAAAAPGATDIPGLPGAPAAPAPAASPAAAATTAAAPAPVAAPPVPAAAPPAAPVGAAPAPAAITPAPRAKPRSRPAAPPLQDERTLAVNRGGPQVHPKVLAGYEAYQAGDLIAARNEYLQALRDEPANRDALLGLAAVEMRAGRFDLADGYYHRLLQADPRDPYAQAGAIALRNNQLDPVLAESRVKSLLANDRNANVLYFTLGNQYAAQGRWADAQQAYFKAFAGDPDNPDFAFNLAVSFDQIRQPKLALEYYRRALALAEKRSASFSLAAARTRVQQLSR